MPEEPGGNRGENPGDESQQSGGRKTFHGFTFSRHLSKLLSDKQLGFIGRMLSKVNTPDWMRGKAINGPDIRYLAESGVLPTKKDKRLGRIVDQIQAAKPEVSKGATPEQGPKGKNQWSFAKGWEEQFGVKHMKRLNRIFNRFDIAALQKKGIIQGPRIRMHDLERVFREMEGSDGWARADDRKFVSKMIQGLRKDYNPRDEVTPLDPDWGNGPGGGGDGGGGGGGGGGEGGGGGNPPITPGWGGPPTDFMGLSSQIPRPMPMPDPNSIQPYTTMGGFGGFLGYQPSGGQLDPTNPNQQATGYQPGPFMLPPDFPAPPAPVFTLPPWVSTNPDDWLRPRGPAEGDETEPTPDIDDPE